MGRQEKAAGTIRVGCQANAWAIDPATPETLFSSLREIDQLGFQGFETGFRNVMRLGDSKEQLANARRGLSFFGVHIFLHEYDAGTCLPPLQLAAEVAEAGAALGA